MDKKVIFGILAIISFASILFTPSGSNAWIYLLVLGLVFGVLWYKNK